MVFLVPLRMESPGDGRFFGVAMIPSCSCFTYRAGFFLTRGVSPLRSIERQKDCPVLSNPICGSKLRCSIDSSKTSYRIQNTRHHTLEN